jgi:hypothetical protein
VEVDQVSIELEKEQVAYQHRFEIRKLILDKLLIALIIFAAGFAGNVILARYKTQSDKNQFLLNKRLEAVQKVSKAYMTMHNKFDTATLEQVLTDEKRDSLHASVQNYIDIWTEWSVILSKRFRTELDYVTWIYLGLESLDLPTMKTYREYLFDLYFKFNAMCQQELDFLDEPEMVSFQFVEWTAAKADSLGAYEFLRANHELWLSSR